MLTLSSFYPGIKRLGQSIAACGFDPRYFLATVAQLPHFVQTIQQYQKSQQTDSFPLRWYNLFPILSEAQQQAGSVSNHYFHQDLWAAKLIFQKRPQNHIDIGSRLDGFIGMLLTFMPVTVLDIRKLDSEVEGLTFVQEDATHLQQFEDNSIDSISSLHAIEHFGLGRYGDPVNATAWQQALHSIARVLKPQGRFYFSVPIGRERVEFNAHRIFSPATVLETLSSLELLSFCAVDDTGQFIASGNPLEYVHAQYSCGLFEFTKR